MSEPIIQLDSIIETIQALDKTMHCPFCKTEPLHFIEYREYGGLEIGCLKCRIKLNFNPKDIPQGWRKPTKKVWQLSGIVKLTDYDIEKLKESIK